MRMSSRLKWLKCSGNVDRALVPPSPLWGGIQGGGRFAWRSNKESGIANGNRARDPVPEFQVA